MASSNININLLILMALISQLYSQNMIELKEENVEFICSDIKECSKRYYIDISSYKNALLTLNLYFSTPGLYIDRNELYHTVSDDLYAECEYGGYIGYSLYVHEEERMHAHFHLNVTAKNKYLIFYRYPVGSYFPLYMSYDLKVVQKDYIKEKSTSDKVLNVIYTIISIAFIIGICCCVAGCCGSSGGGGTYVIFRVD